MQLRNALLYLHSFDGVALEQLAAALQSVEFSLTAPGRQLITLVRDAHDVVDAAKDLMGDEMPVTLADLSARLDRRVNTSWLWYRPDWTSMFCCAAFYPAGVELTFDLNCLIGEDYYSRLLEVLYSYFRQAAAAGQALGLVVDPDGFTEDFEWARFFFETARFSGVLPRVLAVPLTRLGQVVTNTRRIPKETLNDLVIFRPEYDFAP